MKTVLASFVFLCVILFAEPALCQERESEPDRGEPISLDFKDAKMNDVLRFFAAISGRNIVSHDCVGGKVTVRLTEVPWNIAFEMILENAGYGWKEVGDTYRIYCKSDREELARYYQNPYDLDVLVRLVVRDAQGSLAERSKERFDLRKTRFPAMSLGQQPRVDVSLRIHDKDSSAYTVEAALSVTYTLDDKDFYAVIRGEKRAVVIPDSDEILLAEIPLPDKQACLVYLEARKP